MKASTRARSSGSTGTSAWRATSLVIGVLSALSWLTMLYPDPAGADVLVRFVNGREIVAREHWFEGTRMLFTHGRGTVGVPRELVAAIEAVDATREIGRDPKAVNATPLVAPESIR